MKLFEKKNFVKIEKDDLKDAKLSSAGFSDEETQKRAFVDVLGARLAIKMLFSKKIEANNVYSLYTIQNVLKNLDIADIYYAGIKIDVRLVFNREEIFVPKSHFQHKLLPDLYLVLELKEDFSGAEFIGFFEPKNLNQDNVNKDFYFYEPTELQEPEKLKKFLGDFVSEPKPVSSGQDLQKAEELFLSIADNEISQDDKIFLFRQLTNSFDLREKFVEFENFEIISKKVVQDDEIFQDGVLGIVGAQQLFDEDEANAFEQEDKTEVMEEVLSDLIESEEIEMVEDTESFEDDNENFMNELLSENDFIEETTITPQDKGNNTKAGEVILGTIAGAVAGGAVASAAVGVMSGIAAQEVALKGGTELLSSGIELADNITKGALDGVSNSAKPEEKLLDFDFSETEDEDSFLSDLVEESDEQENLFEINEIDELTDLSTIEEPEQGIEEIVGLETTDDFQSEATVEEEYLENNDIFSELEVADEFLQLESEDLPKLQIEEIEELKIDETSVSEETFAPMDSIKIEEEAVLPSYVSNEEIIPNDDLLGVLPELSLGFDNIEPDYLKNFQQEGSLEQDQEPSQTESEMIQEQKIEEENEENLSKLEEFEIDGSEEVEENEENKEDDSDDGYFLSEPEVTFEESPNSESEFTTESEFIANIVDEEPSKITEDNSDNTDSVISEVDAFLKTMDFSEGSDAIADEELDDINLDFLDQDEFKEEATTTAIPATATVEFESGFETKKLTEKDDSLQVLFNDDRIDIPEMFPTGKKILDLVKKDKKVAVAASIAGVMLISFIAGGIITKTKNSSSQVPQDVVAVATPPTANMPLDNNINPGVSQDLNNDTQGLPLDGFEGQPQGQVTKDMSEAASDAFSSEPVNATITKVAWEVPEDLAYNDGFRKYLQVAGKNLKLNLQNDLLLANEMAYSNKVILDLTIAKDGSLTSSSVVSSSGSKQIDKIVLQSVKNTLKYLKMPSDELSGDSANVTLIINF